LGYVTTQAFAMGQRVFALIDGTKSFSASGSLFKGNNNGHLNVYAMTAPGRLLPLHGERSRHF